MQGNLTRLCFLVALGIFLLLSIPKHYFEPVKARAIKIFSFYAPQEIEEQAYALKSLELENGQLKERVVDLEQLLAQMDHLLPSLTTPIGAQVARVIYRSPAFWDSSLWIRTHQGKLLKNSPVVLGNTLIGIIDLEAEHKARVLLITDPQLVVSVRVKRGNALLAKGELAGYTLLGARTKKTRLSGVGFHYDFADKEGPAKDLRTGRPVGRPDSPSVPLLAVGDHLVTTGMDGLFPKGLDVATVISIAPLQEGDYFYDLEAESLASSLSDLTFVFVLPPIEGRQQ